jgi:hypothetical protein
MKQFGKSGWDIAYEEMKQLNDRQIFAPVNASKLSIQEKRKALESFIFLAEKKDDQIKGRICANGSTQREYVGRNQASSPTVSTESIFLTVTIEAEENRDIMTVDIPNAFVQTELNLQEEMIFMKIRGVLVDMLVEINPEMYKE